MRLMRSIRRGIRPARPRGKSMRTLAKCAALPAVAALIGGVFVIAWPMETAAYLKVHPSGEFVDRSGRLLYAFLNQDSQWCFRRELDGVSSYLVRATVATEDKRFYRHPGFDPAAAFRAAWQNLCAGRIVSGGSTLTMQLVKNGDGTERSLPGKCLQAVRAVRLDARCTKEEILEVYLNTASYGMNLVGAEAAARRYFGKTARELTLAEAALLAGLPKSPSAFMPLDHPGRALARRNFVLHRMRQEMFISAGEAAEAMREPLGVAWHELPAMAPHAAMACRSLVSQQGRVHTTIDAAIQQMVERTLPRAMMRYKGDIENAAILVVDPLTAEILAYVGSPGFFSAPAGQIDGCRSPRSPGSALKPFVYALAMEQDQLYSSEILLDDSVDFGRYRPENFDEGYNGLISASDALRHSFNIPAVTVLERVGVEAFHAFLCRAGLSTLTRPARDYGLGLTLGDCEVRLDELAAAYAVLARLGEYIPLELVRTEDVKPTPKRLLERGTCQALYEMLEQPLPEEFESQLVKAAGAVPRVCWKTGTSTGHHDAWAVVFNRHYLVAAWMGNSNGKPSPRLVGLRTALPLAGRIFRALPPKTGPSWPDAGEDLKSVAVCAVSGLPVSSWCDRRRHVLLPRNQFVHRTCDVHHPMPTGSGGGKAAERWPGSPRNWDLARIRAPIIVAADKGSLIQRSLGLHIEDPPDRAEYVLTREPGGDCIRLRTSADERAPLHWYLDDGYLGASTPQQPMLLNLTPGVHTLACMTPAGALDKVRFSVSEPAEVRFNKQ